MDSTELEIANMISFFNQKNLNFSKDFQSYAQNRMRSFAETARILYVDNDAFVQISKDSFRKINVKALNNFTDVKKITLLYDLFLADNETIPYEESLYDVVLFECNDLKEVLIHFYEIDRYRMLFDMIRSTRFISLNIFFNGMEIEYMDGYIDKNYTIELFMYNFLYSYR